MQNVGLVRAKKSKTVDIKLWYSVIVTLLIGLVGSNGGGVLSVGLIILAAPLVFVPQYLICPILFLTAFDDYLVAFQGQSFGRFIVLFFIFGVFLYLVSFKIKLKFTLPIYCAILLALMAVVFSLDGVMGYSSTPLTYVLNMVLFVCLIIYSRIDLKQMQKYLWIASVLIIIFSLYLLLRNGIDAFVSGKVGEIAEGVNANGVAQGLAIAFVIIFVCFVIDGFKNKLVNVVLLAACLTALFLTGSRSSMVGAAMGAIVVYLCWMRLNSKKIFKAVAIIGVIAVGVYFLYNTLYDMFPELMDTFTAEDVLGSGGTGRIDVWAAYFEHYFPDYWLFGVGFDSLNFFYAIKNVNGVGHGPHNILIEILGTMGVVGLIVYLAVFIRSMKKMWRGAKVNLSFLIPIAMFMCCVFNGIGENIVGGRLIWISLGVGLSMSAWFINRKGE